MTDAADEFLSAARKKFEVAAEREYDNRQRALEDIKFARLGEQWPPQIEKQRQDEGRPCLTINRLPNMIRLVVNEARQNRPAVNVVPADSGADVETAEIMSGLIRNIEVSSDADIAYDSAVENAVSGGFGYIRANLAYASDDTFETDIVIERIADPFTVYGDPASFSADGSDWNCAFIVETLTKDEFAAKYKDADAVDWDALGYTGLQGPWIDGDNILVAEYWERKEVKAQIVAMSDGSVVDLADLKKRPTEYQGLTVVGQPRTVKRKQVTQYILSGAEVLETTEWPGKYIPIIPVYGDEVVVEGERHFKSLIHDAVDAQREHNYWRTAAAELVALAPKTPFIGPKGAFVTDIEKWSTANNASHAFIEFDGALMPQRQAYGGPPAAELQQAMASVDDIKSIVGIYDASLGAQGNETSGVAIRQRQRQGNVATFHFIDNLQRAIRQVGRVLIDLIPKVYTTARVVRILGDDMKPQNVQVAPQAEHAQMQQQAQMQGNPISRIYDLSAGKYDLVVKSGPSFSTQREEARSEIVEIIRANPAAAPILGPMYLRNSDWPGAEKAAVQMEQASHGNPQAQQQMQAMQGAIQQGQQRLAQLEAENQALKQANEIKMFEAQTKRMEAQTKAQEVAQNGQIAVMDAVQQRNAAQSPPSSQFGLG